MINTLEHLHAVWGWSMSALRPIARATENNSGTCLYVVWQGFVARVIHVSATTALMKTLTSVVYDLIYG